MTLEAHEIQNPKPFLSCYKEDLKNAKTGLKKAIAAKAPQMQRHYESSITSLSKKIDALQALV